MIKRSIASMVDQALLSGLNFLVGIYLIAAIPKEAYGLYVQLFAVGVLSCAVLDALIANALANLSSRLSSDDMAAKVVSAQLLARLLGFVLALVGMGLAYGLQTGVQHGMGRLQLAFAFGCYLAALSFRDFKRVLLYLEQRTFDVMKLDGIFVAGALLGGLGLHLAGIVSLLSVLLALTLANMLALFLTASKISSSSRDTQWSTLRGAWLEFWNITHWALPGLALGWLGTSLYLYVAGFHLGLDATAELNASRLLLMPVTLLTVAWQQMARSDIAKLIQGGRKEAFPPFLIRSAVVIFLPVVLYLTVLYACFDIVSALISAEKYFYFADLLNIWVVYMLIYSVKFVGTVLMVGFGDFLILLKVNILSLSLQIALLFILPSVWGIESVVWCLIASEILEGIVIWMRLLPRRLRALNGFTGVSA